ncbi:MAG: low molecular weight phosphotyrosine protein phosphatase [Lachnospiraceae bacterium]|nr:low molecular weight phosphotyrosine protein phosphatase [Lachnospiraceae bacterium]
MIKILFVCWGNICRSPMAEFIMKDLVEKNGLSSEFYIESAATSTEEIGNGVYPPAKSELARHGIGVPGNELGLSLKRARQMTRSDYDKYDYIIGMENLNLSYMNRILGGDPDGKVHLMMDFTDHPEDIDDPWYTGDFSGVYKQILEGCECLLKKCNS